MNQLLEQNETATLMEREFTIECWAWGYHAYNHGWETKIGETLSESHETRPVALAHNKHAVTLETSTALKARGYRWSSSRTFVFSLNKSFGNLTTTTVTKLSIPMIYIKEAWSCRLTAPSTQVLLILITWWIKA